MILNAKKKEQEGLGEKNPEIANYYTTFLSSEEPPLMRKQHHQTTKPKSPLQ